MAFLCGCAKDIITCNSQSHNRKLFEWKMSLGAIMIDIQHVRVDTGPIYKRYGMPIGVLLCQMTSFLRNNDVIIAQCVC